MAVYTPDLSAMVTGQEVAGFTKRFVANFSWTIRDEPGTPYGKVIRCPSEAASDQNGLTLDAIDSDPDRREGETFIQFRTKASIDATSLYALFSAVSASATQGARIGADPKDSEVNGGRYNAGSFASFVSATTYTFEADTRYNLLTKATPDGASYRYRAWLWKAGDPEPATSQVDEVNNVSSDSNLRGLFRFDAGAVDIEYVSFSTGTDVADRPTSLVPTTRKGSTFTVDKPGTLGTVTTATLNAVNVFDHLTAQDATTATFAGAFTDEITTSGTYDLVLGDGTVTETITIQVNVVGLPAHTFTKDGAGLASLSDVEIDLFNSAGIAISLHRGSVTTDVNGVIPKQDYSSSYVTNVGDTHKVSIYSPSAGVGITFEQAMELI